jgi:formylglycine-generating enzyme required for sulfatase activity
MASGGDEPVTDGGGGKHSVFANALMRGLREMDKAKFTAAELFRYYVEERVAGRAEQTPEYNPLRNSGHQNGDFVFTKIKTEGKTGEVAVKAPTLANADTGARSTSEAVGATAAVPKAGTVVRNRLGIELVYVPPGEFAMGATNGGAAEKPVRTVTIRDGFFLGKYEVTQSQWQAVMGTNFVGCDNCPVDMVAWDDVQTFLERLNKQNDGFVYRLPSEAEWEYACRAGSTRDHAGYIDTMAWYEANSNKQAHPVGQKQPNAFGLYDMHGNVWEWVQDAWHANYTGAPTDGTAWLSETGAAKRVLRGGSWYNQPPAIRSAIRTERPPNARANTIGFRLAAVAKKQ